jgi:hypothetical protein
MRTAAIFLSLLLAGCAPAPPSTGRPITPSPSHGVSGPITWRIEDVREELRPAENEVRWHYVLILTNTGREHIDFTREEVAIYLSGSLIGAPRERPFDSRLVAGAERRLTLWQSVYLKQGSQSSGTPTAGGFQSLNRYGNLGAPSFWRRLHGADRFGKPVVVEVRFGL